MPKITTADLHQNDASSSAFSVCILSLLAWVRQYMATLEASRKADEQAPGSLHALRKLCDGESQMWQVRSYLHRSEIEEWQEIFFAWLNRVNRWIPKELQADFKKNAEDDFRVLLELAGNGSDASWRKKSLERSIKITFESDEALKKARKLADEKYPVKLGSALHKYIDAAIQDLQGLETPQQSVQVVATPRPLISIDRNESGVYSILLDDFAAFEDAELKEQGVEITAYDLEDCLRSLAGKRVLAAKDFDCESSMFVFRSKKQEKVQLVLKLLCDLLDDVGLRDEHLHKK